MALGIIVAEKNDVLFVDVVKIKFGFPLSRFHHVSI